MAGWTESSLSAPPELVLYGKTTIATGGLARSCPLGMAYSSAPYDVPKEPNGPYSLTVIHTLLASAPRYGWSPRQGHCGLLLSLASEMSSLNML